MDNILVSSLGDNSPNFLRQLSNLHLGLIVIIILVLIYYFYFAKKEDFNLYNDPGYGSFSEGYNRRTTLPDNQPPPSPY